MFVDLVPSISFIVHRERQKNFGPMCALALVDASANGREQLELPAQALKNDRPGQKPR